MQDAAEQQPQRRAHGCAEQHARPTGITHAAEDQKTVEAVAQRRAARAAAVRPGAARTHRTAQRGRLVRAEHPQGAQHSEQGSAGTVRHRGRQLSSRIQPAAAKNGEPEPRGGDRRKAFRRSRVHRQYDRIFRPAGRQHRCGRRTQEAEGRPRLPGRISRLRSEKTVERTFRTERPGQSDRNRTCQTARRGSQNQGAKGTYRSVTIKFHKTKRARKDSGLSF